MCTGGVAAVVQSGVCIIEAGSFSVFTSDGRDYIAALPFPVWLVHTKCLNYSTLFWNVTCYTVLHRIFILVTFVFNRSGWNGVVWRWRRPGWWRMVCCLRDRFCHRKAISQKHRESRWQRNVKSSGKSLTVLIKVICLVLLFVVLHVVVSWCRQFLCWCTSEKLLNHSLCCFSS